MIRHCSRTLIVQSFAIIVLKYLPFFYHSHLRIDNFLTEINVWIPLVFFCMNANSNALLILSSTFWLKANFIIFQCFIPSSYFVFALLTVGFVYICTTLEKFIQNKFVQGIVFKIRIPIIDIVCIHFSLFLWNIDEFNSSGHRTFNCNSNTPSKIESFLKKPPNWKKDWISSRSNICWRKYESKWKTQKNPLQRPEFSYSDTFTERVQNSSLELQEVSSEVFPKEQTQAANYVSDCNIKNETKLQFK